MKAMETSPSTGIRYGVKRVCEAWGVARSTLYHCRKRKLSGVPKSKPGPKPMMPDEMLIEEIRKVITGSPFSGEGHRKVHARLGRKKLIRVGRSRVLRLMKANRLLSPYRAVAGDSKIHDGKITTDAPNEMWATDAAKIFTAEDGWVWFFGIIEHWNAQCMGWHVCKKGDRFAAMDALANGLRSEYGSIERVVASGLTLRTDHGSQFKSEAFRKQVQYWGITTSFGFVKEPQTNGVIERFHRTLKEQAIYGRTFRTVEDVRKAVSDFIQRYNEEWLLEKLEYRSPLEARRAWENAHAA